MGTRLDRVGLPGAKSLGVEYGPTFELWEAAVAAGAGLDDLWRLDMGHYPKWFKAKLIAWFRFHELLKLHRELARQPKGQPKPKKR